MSLARALAITMLLAAPGGCGDDTTSAQLDLRAAGDLAAAQPAWPPLYGGDGGPYSSCGATGVALSCSAVQGGCYRCLLSPGSTGVCVQPCNVARGTCPGGQTCVAIFSASFVDEGDCVGFDGFCTAVSPP